MWFSAQGQPVTGDAVAESPQATTPRRQLCAVVAREQGEDPIGTAWATERMVVVEVPLPWPADILEARSLPLGLADVVMGMYDTHPNVGMVAVAPDDDYSRAGWARVIDFAYPAPPRAATDRYECLVPLDRVAEFVARRLAGDPTAAMIPGVEPQSFAGRDLLVCTHGTVDACCALFGYPFYRDLRRAARATAGTCRVWRSTHFGGHRFAPTVLDLPEGRYWGFMTSERGEALVTRAGEVADLRESYRGWAGYEAPEVQSLEREAFVREGWAWCTWPQRAEIVVQDQHGDTFIRIDAFPPTGQSVTYSSWVGSPGTVTTLFETDGETSQRPTYRVRDLQKRVDAPMCAAQSRRLDSRSQISGNRQDI